MPPSAETKGKAEVLSISMAPHLCRAKCYRAGTGGGRNGNGGETIITGGTGTKPVCLAGILLTLGAGILLITHLLLF